MAKNLPAVTAFALMQADSLSHVDLETLVTLALCAIWESVSAPILSVPVLVAHKVQCATRTSAVILSVKVENVAQTAVVVFAVLVPETISAQRVRDSAQIAAVMIVTRRGTHAVVALSFRHAWKVWTVAWIGLMELIAIMESIVTGPRPVMRRKAARRVRQLTATTV